MADADVVWTVLTDTRLWPIWGPSVRDVETAQHIIGPGSSGRVKTVFGFWVPFEVTAFEPKSFWSWKVAGIQATGHRVRHLAPGVTELEFSVPFWAAPYLAICALAARRIGRLARKEQK
ncbi:MAG: SRPBCC family protein [Desulfovibrionales bacterium]